MGYQPECMVNDCPACGERPRVRLRLLSSRVRLECVCGVAGQWVRDDVYRAPWNVAAAGWEKVAGVVQLGPPPNSRRD